MIHQLLTFEVCRLVDPVAYMVAVWVRALHSDPVPIPHVYQHLPPHIWAACFMQADIFTCVVYLPARQGKYQNIVQNTLPQTQCKSLPMFD